ncbi:MAG: type II secretion system protein GspM [Spirochaetota bacterium]
MLTLTVTEREKKMLYVLGAIVAFMALYYLVFIPVRNLTQAPDSSTHLEEQLQELSDIHAAYSRTRNKRQKLERQLNDRNDAATANITRWADENGISGNIAYTRRTQTNIQNKYVRTNTDIKINGAPIQSLVGFIHDIEQSDDLVFITYVSFTKGLKSRKTYDALIKIHSFSAR